MKKCLCAIILCLTFKGLAQKDSKSFFELSGPKQTWVIFHPFKAKQSYRISLEANKVADSIKQTNLLDKDGAGGQIDAFRHAYWMARLRQEIGKSAARSLGKAHERENYQTYKKRKLEDGVVPDEISSKMDLFNNEKGLEFTQKGSEISKKGLIFRIINAIKAGELRVIKKDEKGNFLTCDGKIIPRKSLLGKWKNNKCLVTSNN